MSNTSEYKGAMAFMAKNHVAANLLMLIFIVGGIMLAPNIKQEVFPEVTLDTVSIQVIYPGAGPEEVEQGVILAVEEAVRGIDGVREIRSTALESVGTVSAELSTDVEAFEALNDIKSAVDRITSLPRDAERPVVTLLSNRNQVISLVIYGDGTERELRALGEEVREEILQDPRVTLAELGGVRNPEISIEVPQDELRRHDLTLDQIAQTVGRASIELPGGGVKTSAGEVLMRVTERRDWGTEFEEVALKAAPDGSVVRVRDLANVVDGFEETDREAFFNSKRAVRVDVYRIGSQTPTDVADAVKSYVEEKLDRLPEGYGIAVWNDRSEIFQDRMNLLLKNAYIGVFLVLIILGIFLEIRLAFWVTSGIAVSVLGAMLFMPALDVSINMISLFAFILTLGIVVDDAIVGGEAIYHHRQQGKGLMESSIEGIREVWVPIVFSVLTTVVAFMPLLFIPGTMGKFWNNIPLIVIPILLLSIVDALFILPAHLAHTSRRESGIIGWIDAKQARFSALLETFIERVYRPSAEFAFKYRYLTVALGLATLILTFGMLGGGRLKFTFFPKVEGDVVTATLQLPFGSPIEDTRAVVERIQAGGIEALEELGGDELSRGMYADIGAGAASGMGASVGGGAGSHLANVQIFLVPAKDREVTTAQFANLWRQKVGEIPGVDTLQFQFNIGPARGQPVSVELSHRDPKILEFAASRVAESLATYEGVFDTDAGYTPGKDQLDFQLKPEARALGLTETDLARQVRASFFGAEVTRQQRGRDELRVFVRRPMSERNSEFDVETMMIRTPQGGEMPLSEAATVVRGKSYTNIQRVDARRVLTVTADVDEEVTTGQIVTQAVINEVMPKIAAEIPGLSYGAAGQEQDRAEMMDALKRNFTFALLAMFALMAFALGSYLQPLLIMSAIPFGVVGAVLGHMVLGFDVSVISLMGMVALSGVVVNDSIVLVDAINTFRREGMSPWDAVVAGGTRRFRPVLLTSLTTFFGLAPMILETSPQARFLVPMAVSLGFGIMFTTIIVLGLVPCIYLIADDVKRWFTPPVDVG